MGKKNLSAKEKMAIVMAGIKGDKTVARDFPTNCVKAKPNIIKS